MLRALTLLACACLALSSPAQAKVYNAQSAMLDNGMRVVVIPVHRTPALTHMLWYRVGAADEPFGHSGTAHFLEHLMFKGTPNVPAGTFSPRIARMGGTDNAFTSLDYTAYYQSIPKTKLADVMRMESERMNDLTPSLADVYAEKKVVIEERRQRTDGTPAAQMMEAMRAALFPNHPYGRPVLGWMGEMQKLTWVESLAFYKQHYAPNNAILVISGDVTMDEVLPLAKSTYGTLPAEIVPPRARPQSPRLNAEAQIHLASPDVHQPQYVWMLRAPSQRHDAKTALTLTLLQDLLSGATGPLYLTMSVQDKIATNVGMSYDPFAWDDSTIIFYATPAANTSLEVLAKALHDLLADIAKKGFTDDEIDRARARLLAESTYARDSLAGPAMAVGEALATGAKLRDIENWPDDLAAITNADLVKMLNTYVLDQKGVSGWLTAQGGDK